ncbi:MAG: TlpA family protein disulfide reductase [Rhodospirillaceae bacterium]
MALGRRELLALGGIGAAAAVAGAVIGTLGLHSTSAANALLAYPFQQLDGRSTRLRDWHQRLILCNFWATWCAPCREEVPLLVAAKQQFLDNGLEIAGIGVDLASKLQQFSSQYAINYPVLTSTGDMSALMRELGDGPGALPYSVLLDHKRRIAYRKLGAWTKTELDREIRAAMG